jgi:DNA-binding transcriptional MerR regulator
VTDGTASYGVDELAERAGVSRRTIRYYVQRGILPPPLGLGRGNHYSEEHLATLVRVRELQEAGVSLEVIIERLRGDDPGSDSRGAPAPTVQTTWTRIELADGVELHVRGRRLSDEQIHELKMATSKVLGE